jgi:hypothetical protein
MKVPNPTGHFKSLYRRTSAYRDNSQSPSMCNSIRVLGIGISEKFAIGGNAQTIHDAVARMLALSNGVPPSCGCSGVHIEDKLAVW